MARIASLIVLLICGVFLNATALYLHTQWFSQASGLHFELPFRAAVGLSIALLIINTGTPFHRQSEEAGIPQVAVSTLAPGIISIVLGFAWYSLF